MLKIYLIQVMSVNKIVMVFGEEIIPPLLVSYHAF